MISNDLHAVIEPFQLVLANRRVLAIDGSDATAFLQAQLTTDVASLSEGQWRLAGYCSAKGRLLASGLLWKSGAGWRWLVADDIAAALVKRLRMFVLRLKVSIEVMDAAVVGQVGSSTPSQHQVSEPLDEVVFTWLGLPEALGQQRAFGLVSDQHLDRFLADPASNRPDAVELWNWLEVRSGLSFIEAATQDKFVPQMVNLEALGGVDFKKGCYPGQEVVARSQYLGKLKRRTLLAHALGDTAASVGTDVYTTSSMEPIGTVVSRASDPSGGIDYLIEAPLAAWSEGLSVASSIEGRLEPLDLPYPLPDNEVFVRPRL